MCLNLLLSLPQAAPPLPVRKITFASGHKYVGQVSNGTMSGVGVYAFDSAQAHYEGEVIAASTIFVSQLGFHQSAITEYRLLLHWHNCSQPATASQKSIGHQHMSLLADKLRSASCSSWMAPSRVLERRPLPMACMLDPSTPACAMASVRISFPIYSQRWTCSVHLFSIFPRYLKLLLLLLLLLPPAQRTACRRIACSRP